MASFVNEVLSSAGKLETQEVQGKLDILTKRIEGLKLQVHDISHGKYVSLQPSLKTSEDLVCSVENISQEMQEVAEKIETEVKSQLNMSTGVVHSLKNQLDEAADIMTVLQSLVQVQDALQCVASANVNSDFTKAADSISDIHQILTDDLIGYKDAKIMMALQTEFCVHKEQFLYDLGEKWSKLIEWTVSDGKEEKRCQLKIASGNSNLKVLKDVVIAMEKMAIFDTKLKVFSNKVVSYFIQPCILNDKSTIKDISEPDTKTLSIYFADTEQMSPPSAVVIFANLLSVLNFLNEGFLHITVEEAERKEILMRRFGALVCDQVLDMVVKECLTRSIPTSNKDLTNFSEVLDMVKDFHSKLVDLHFIPEYDTVLLDFVQNVNVLFANKKCQEILVKARGLMTSDIHNTVLVSDNKPLGELPPLGPDGPSGKKMRKLDLASECKISINTFKLPSCHISECIRQLLSLAYETLHEATESSPQCAIQMFYAVRNMLELFCSVFPTYHKKNLATFPQLSAIFHNNCLFVAHHLMTLGHQFRQKLPDNITVTFVDLVPKIRKLGVEIFLKQSSRQKAMMTEYLKGAKGFESVSEKNLYRDAERAIKQVLHQFQHLQKVWQDVLPPVTYRKAIGTLLNSVVQDIAACIVSLEDISSEDAQQIATLLMTILDKAGQLFVTSADENINIALELQKNVPKWLRFKELIMVLNASLLEISDRWAEGKGPLAIEFSPNEMKQLIRALFQNTERRAAVLSKIK